MLIRYHCLSAFCFLFVLQLSAQNRTAPYSIYGVGDFGQPTSNNAGMGFSGIGLKSSYTQNGANPASVAGLPTSLLLLQGSGSGRRASFSGTGIDASNRVAKDFSFTGLSLATKFNKAWGSSVGLRQLSYVGYQFSASKQVSGTTATYPLRYSGDGGLYDFYWNNAVNLGKHLAIGVTGSFIAGPINQTESTEDESGNVFTSTRRDYYGNFRINTGALYTASLNKKWTLGLGAQYAPKSQLNYERTFSLSTNGSAVLTDTGFSFHTGHMPGSWGAGISLGSKKTTWAADYTADNWSSLQVRGNGWRLANSRRASAGVSFNSENNERGTAVWQKSFQFGGFYQTGYQQVRGHQLAGYGITAGISRMLKNGFKYELGMEAGTRGISTEGLIRENYLQLSVQLSYRDFFRSKGQRFN